MKHVSCILLLALLAWGPSRLHAGCPAKTINGQTQLDEYVASLGSCNVVDGTLVLEGAIHDLSGLDEIQEVQGDLLLSGLDIGALYNVFPNLGVVDGDLRLSSNDNLGNVNHGFAALKSIGGDLSIADNDALFIVDGFSMLASIGGDFIVSANHLLASLPLFEKLTTVGDLIISFNDLLSEVNGFQYLTSINGDLIFESNGILKSILAFSRLETIEGDLLIIDNYALVNLGLFPSLLSVQELALDGNANIETLGGFDYLLTAEQINIYSNPSLVTLEGFARLTSINDQVDIYDNDELIYLMAFGGLRTIGGGLNISEHLKLPSINGFAQLQSIGGSLIVQNNSALQGASAFGALLSVGDVLEITNNPLLENLYAFSLLTSIGSNLDINNNDLGAITFPRLLTIGGSLLIEFEHRLEQLIDFSNLGTIGGQFLVRSNNILKKIGGFGKLTYVDDLFEISNNPNLLAIDGFGRVSTMGLDLIIQDNQTIRSIDGFGSLRSLGDDLRVRDNPMLESIFAFEILESVQMLEVFNNPQLYYCCGIGYLIQVVGYTSLNMASNSEGCNSPAEIDAACNATLSDCTPNCIGFINASLDRYGIATIHPRDFVSDTLACMSGVEVTVEDNLGAIVFGPKVVGLNGAVPIKACQLLRRQPLKVTTRGVGGACWSELTFKQTNGPTVQQDTAITVLCGDPLAKEPAPGTGKTAWIPCQPELQASWITDWVMAFDCEAGVQDTVKIIYREWEAYDKEGRRGVSFDTIYVLQFPEILPENIYCEQKDTVFCADTTALIGPYITYNDPLNGCQQTYLVSAADKNNDGTLEFIPRVFDTKCGLTVHVDYKKFPGDCENNYRVIVDIKQHCYGPGDPMTCMVPIPAGTLPNAAEQIDTGYWRCEFWVVDLDTLAPELVCKGDDLFSGPFDISRFGLYDNFFNTVPVGLPAIAAGEPLEQISTFDLSKLPYALSIESKENFVMDDFELEETEDDDASAAVNGFIPARFFSNAVMSYEAEDDQTFSFSWDFTMATQQDDMVILPTFQALPVNAPAVASVFYSLNGSSFRLLEGESIEEVEVLRRSGTSALISSHSLNMIDPVAVSGSQYGFNHIPLSKGDVLYIVALWDSPVDATFRIMGLNQVSTSKTECVAHSYIPSIEAVDDWSGVKQAKATIEDIGSFQLTYDQEEHCWSSHERVRLPYQIEPYKIFYEVFDSCHNVGYDSCYLYVKDLVKPVPVIDKGFTVSLGDKKVWVDREAFDEGSFDNCELNFFLIRRADWYETCVNLCDSLEPICITEHHDTIWRPILELDKRVDQVEAHYAKTLGWIKNESEACGELLYNAWQYDLMKYATLYCKQSYDFPLTEEGFASLIDSCAYDLQPYFAGVPFHADDDRYQRKLTTDLIDQYAQIGGGWSDQVVFSCEDACGPVTIEVLVMDYWCNWSTAWTTVWVEDKVAPEIVKEVLNEANISCKTYKEKNVAFEGSLNPVSIADIVEKGKYGDSLALYHLDKIFGGYQKAWVDPYGRYVDLDGDTIACDIPLYDSICQCTTETKSIRVYDDHLGYVWKDSIISNCFYELEEKTFQQGIVKVNCNQNVYCEQQVWCDFDHCGQGFIQRKFKIWQRCPSSFYNNGHIPDSIKHPVDTIYRQQRIWVGNECDLNKYMFEVPRDTTIYACGVIYDGQGNVVGDASPGNIGEAKYKFDDDCRLVGIAHQDRAFKIIGGGYNACYKILRTWYFADWCAYGESTNPYWWSDYDLVLDSCVQVIFVKDTTAPICRIRGPVSSGETFAVGTCDYDLNVDVEMEDLCGIASYEWQLFDIAKGAYTLVAEGEGQWSGLEQSTFNISVEDLDFSTYKLEVNIVDECRNKAYCTYEITLQSVKKPTPICITSLTARLTPWDLDNDGIADTALAVIWADEFDQSSKPACGDEYLEFRLDLLDGDDDDAFAGDADSLLLGCDQLGVEMVRLWVISQPSGTSDYCDVLVVTQSDFAGCVPVAPSEVVRFEIPIDRIVKTTVKKGEGSGIVLDIPRDAAQVNGNLLQGEFHLEQNRPNPFQDETFIEFSLPEAGQVQLTFHDVTGRVLKTIQGTYPKGVSTVNITHTDMGVHGMIYYHMQAGKFAATRKMLALP